ncbi:MAG TPA: type IV pili twitching motility protein PilT, partial [Verrucomicrobiota bacterium]|nr:type IV pili twitching motility protein PilT [Verrucomicrobiota bacterium]
MSAPETAPATLATLLHALVQNGGSDLHLQAGEAPMARIHGGLGRFELPPLTEADVLRIAREILGSDEKLAAFLRDKDHDTA